MLFLDQLEGAHTNSSPSIYRAGNPTRRQTLVFAKANPGTTTKPTDCAIFGSMRSEQHRSRNISTIQYEIAPENWTPDDENPFTSDGTYGNGWSCFSTTADFEFRFFTGRSKSGCWSIQFRKGNQEYQEHLGDFLIYENGNYRTVILDLEKKDEAKQIVARCLGETLMSGFRRSNDAQYMVHSTTEEAWRSIEASGELTAAAFLRERWNFDDEDNGTDAYLKDEPPEYKEYIMLGGIDTMAPELVVASYQARKFISDPDVQYEPGVRIYIRNYAIIDDQLDVRDGIHPMKVHKRIAIGRYLETAIRASNLELMPGEEYWTPKLFVQKANAAFQEAAG